MRAPTPPRRQRSPRVPLNGLRPAVDLAAGRAHGDRLRYIAGCRCDLCRKANSAYERERIRARREGDWNGIVSAEKARAHLIKLSKQGVGRRAVAYATDVAESIVHQIRMGTRTRVRARTERLILKVSPAMALDGANKRAARTWKLIDELREEGYTDAFIAKRLGYKRPALQFGRTYVTVRNAARVERLHRELTE